MKPNIGITPENLSAVANALNGILADEFVLYTKTRNAHWNVEGPDFHGKHMFFEAEYQALDDIVDNVAERIRSLGHYALGTLKSLLDITHLAEVNHNENNGDGFIKELLNDHESIIITLREYINSFANKFHDTGTSDFVTGLLETHEKMAWMLRAHLR